MSDPHLIHIDSFHRPVVVDLSSGPPYALKIRNAANTAWEAVGVAKGENIMAGVSWDPEIAYGKGDIVSGNDYNVYVSLVIDNLGNDPTTDGGVNWKLAGS